MRAPSRAARFRERAQRRRQAAFDGLAELLDVLRRLLEHPGPTQHLMRRQRPRIAKTRAHALLERAQPLERPGDDRVRRRAALVGADLQRAIDLAALDRGRDELPAFGLDRAQLLRQAEAELQKPVIDAANLPNESERPDARFRGRESGHAVRHSIESGDGFSQSERRSALRNPSVHQRVSGPAAQQAAMRCASATTTRC